MSGKSVPDDSFRSIAPMFGVKNIEQTVEFYQERLGFSVQGIWKDIGPYAIVRRGGVVAPMFGVKNIEQTVDSIKRDWGSRIHFFQVKEEDSGHTSVYISVDDANAVYEELKNLGHTNLKPPTDKPYGRRDFGVPDLDGHWLFFSSPSPSA